MPRVGGVEVAFALYQVAAYVFGEPARLVLLAAPQSVLQALGDTARDSRRMRRAARAAAAPARRRCCARYAPAAADERRPGTDGE